MLFLLVCIFIASIGCNQLAEKFYDASGNCEEPTVLFLSYGKIETCRIYSYTGQYVMHGNYNATANTYQYFTCPSTCPTCDCQGCVAETRTFGECVTTQFGKMKYVYETEAETKEYLESETINGNFVFAQQYKNTTAASCTKDEMYGFSAFRRGTCIPAVISPFPVTFSSFNATCDANHKLDMQTYDDGTCSTTNTMKMMGDMCIGSTSYMNVDLKCYSNLQDEPMPPSPSSASFISITLFVLVAVLSVLI